MKKPTPKELQEILKAMEDHYKEGLQLKKRLLEAIDKSKLKKLQEKIQK